MRRNRKPLVQFKEAENKQDPLAREVVGAQISFYWAYGWLEVPEIMWVRTNDYKFHTFRSVHFHLSLSPRPSFRFSEGLVPRLEYLWGCWRPWRAAWKVNGIQEFPGQGTLESWPFSILGGLSSGVSEGVDMWPKLLYLEVSWKKACVVLQGAGWRLWNF